MSKPCFFFLAMEAVDAEVLVGVPFPQEAGVFLMLGVVRGAQPWRCPIVLGALSATVGASAVGTLVKR